MTLRVKFSCKYALCTSLIFHARDTIFFTTPLYGHLLKHIVKLPILFRVKSNANMDGFGKNLKQLRGT